MEERLKLLRKTLGLNQKEFGQKINLSGAQIGSYEIGRRDLTTRVIEDICREFNVNKEWLTTGEGDIFIESEVFSLDQYAKENNMTELEVEIFKRFLGLDVEMRTKVIDFMSTTFGNRTTSSVSETGPQNLAKKNLNEFATVEEAEEAYKKSRLNSALKTTSSVTSSTNDKSKENLKVVK